MEINNHTDPEDLSVDYLIPPTSVDPLGPARLCYRIVRINERTEITPIRLNGDFELEVVKSLISLRESLGARIRRHIEAEYM